MKRINALMNTEYRSQWEDRPVFLAPRSAPANGSGSGAWTRLRAGLGAVAAQLRRARARRITYRQLASLDDHLLADIGLRRDQLREYADGLVAGRGSAQGPCTVTQLSTPRRTVGETRFASERAA